MKRFSIKVAALAATYMIAMASAQAVTIVSSQAITGAKRVHITNAFGDASAYPLQVAEVIALDSGINVAAAAHSATASTNSQYSTSGSDSAPSNAIDGLFPASYPNIYHSGNSGTPYLDIVFNAASSLSSLKIYGRGDGGFNLRDVYNVSIFNAANAVLYSGQLDARDTGFAQVNFAESPVGAVPEPSTWAMMLLGFGVIGFGLRRRKTAPKVSCNFA